MSQILLFIVFGISMFNLQERSDFTGLVISCSICFLYIQEKNISEYDSFKLILNFLIFGVFYDIVWIIFHHGGYWVDSWDNSSLKKVVYIFSYINCFAKLILYLSVHVTKHKELKKKREIKERNSRVNFTGVIQTGRKSTTYDGLFKSGDKGRVSTQFFYSNDTKPFGRKSFNAS